MISQISNLPYELLSTQKKIAFYRNKFYSKKYLLDSALFMSKNQIYDYHGFKRQKDYACMGVILFNLKKYHKIMKEYFFSFDSNIKTITGGDEPVLNYLFQNNHEICWLDYKFQALWIYEIVNNYPFLYKYKTQKNYLIKDCVTTTLLKNYFLHFGEILV